MESSIPSPSPLHIARRLIDLRMPDIAAPDPYGTFTARPPVNRGARFQWRYRERFV
jgi:hypothetical protein